MSSRMLRFPSRTAAWRISLWSTIAFAVGAAVAFAIMYVLVADTARERGDAWLSGEAEVLAEVAGERPRDTLYNRVVEEVAELAAQEVPDERSRSGQKLNSVFFLGEGPKNEPPLWVGPGSSQPFIEAVHSTPLTPGIPQSITVAGWKQPFRVVERSRRDGKPVYLGLSDRGAVRLLHRLTRRFVGVWLGVVVMGFLISHRSLALKWRRKSVLEMQEPASNVHGAAGERQGVGPERAGRVHHLDFVLDRANETLDLRLGDHQLGRRLQNHEIVSAHLGEDLLLAEQPHHQHLAKHAGVDLGECLKGQAQGKRLGRPELDAAEQAFSHDAGDHFVAAERLPQTFAQPAAQA
jgi:hypothetical protein